MADIATATEPLAIGEVVESGDGVIVLAVAKTDYRLHLQVEGDASQKHVGKIVRGRIFCQGRRVDVMRRGGRFIEPVYGRPRRLQGQIVAVDGAGDTMTVCCGGGCPFVCKLMPGQRAADFEHGMLVGLDVERGARFETVGDE